jgi:hypothetical protein
MTLPGCASQGRAEWAPENYTLTCMVGPEIIMAAWNERSLSFHDLELAVRLLVSAGRLCRAAAVCVSGIVRFYPKPFLT